MGKWKTKTRFPTFPRGTRDHDYEFLPQNQKPKQQKGNRPLRGLFILTLQDHLVLETLPGFRIILGLENALLRRPESTGEFYRALRDA